MAFTVAFFNNDSPNNKIGKDISAKGSITGTLRAECSIMNPVILFEASGIPNANYMYIGNFDRYYYINEIRSIRDGLWEVSGRVDVLQSYRSQILAQTVTLSDTGSAGADPYMNSDVYQVKVKTKTDIVSFPSGLLDNGTFILITAGGSGSLS